MTSMPCMVWDVMSFERILWLGPEVRVARGITIVILVLHIQHNLEPYAMVARGV